MQTIPDASTAPSISNSRPAAVSPWIERWSHLLPPAARVLDVACGHGRHARWLHGRGHEVTAVDRCAEAIAAVQPFARAVCADIENGPWPFAGLTFDAVIVTHYLWRPLLPALVASLAPGGVLLYETFAAGNERLGRPARPEFLLQPGELLRACEGLHILAYENGFLDHPARCIQRVAALRETVDGPTAAHHRLEPPL